jgi:GNAT superfamily N-acetyltransferase
LKSSNKDSDRFLFFGGEEMPTIKVYDPSMQPALESCFKACVKALGWEYQPDSRHSDIVNIEEAYMRRGCFWCLFQDEALIGMAAARCIDSGNRIVELKRLYVLPEYQGKGYGGMLFKHALDYVKEQFSLDEPVLAYPCRPEYDEYFWPGIFAAPHGATMQMLETAKNLQDALDTIPDMITEQPDITEEAI